MAHLNTSTSLVRRSADDVALMPPPPVKRIKRPHKVLDEDDYTCALSDIIARDYFPGLRESQAQQEYLSALGSSDQGWIAEAGQKLREAMTPHRERKRRSERDRSFDRRSRTGSFVPNAADTPRGYDGSQTPTADEQALAGENESPEGKPSIDTSALSLSLFSTEYTSEDNESFNALLDKQNQKRREKHAYMWTPHQRIPSARQIAYRKNEQRLLKQHQEDKTNAAKDGKELVPISTGATGDRPARPDGWKVKKPDNTFMFFAPSVDEDGFTTEQDRKEAASKAGPKQVIHENTRFPPLQYIDDDTPGSIPPSPSLNTDIIARRDAARAARSESESVAECPGGETPRVNGYAFVDEDEPSAAPAPAAATGPSYRDLLAGQVGDSTPNPFKISSIRSREEVHHRLVEKTNQKKRDKDKETLIGTGGDTPVTRNVGNMTPAARKLMERMGRTPVNVRDERMSSVEMWTPRATPRRRAVK